MKALALYLPQFHQVPENDEWWGPGFTEWTSVRNATPLFKGHAQPQEPLDGNYYDLTDADSLIWQADLASKYGLGGFVFFHYWSEGKLLLERPVNLYRATPDAQMDYALCWANHPWTRSWDGKEHEILQAQTYGGREDWDSHIEYLLPHFADARYIKRDGRPVLFLYNTSAIPNVDEMLRSWNARLHQEGFNDLFVVEYISSKNPEPASSLSAAVYEDEPVYSLRFEIPIRRMMKRLLTKKTQRIDFQDYRDVWSRILSKKRTYGGREIVQGAFVGWDNSPRRGARGPMIVKNASPEVFEECLAALVAKPREHASENYVVINAWNEWGEGAVLEPTEQDGHRYLEALRRVFGP